MKKITIAGINCSDRVSSGRAINSMLVEYGVIGDLTYKFNKYLKKENFPLDTERHIFSASQILNSIEENFSLLNKYIGSSCFLFVHYIESEIAKKCMMHMIKKGINPLSIHDAFLVPNNCIKEMEEAFENIFMQVTMKMRKTSKKLNGVIIPSLNITPYKSISLKKKMNKNIISTSDIFVDNLIDSNINVNIKTIIYSIFNSFNNNIIFNSKTYEATKTTKYIHINNNFKFIKYKKLFNNNIKNNVYLYNTITKKVKRDVDNIIYQISSIYSQKLLRDNYV